MRPDANPPNPAAPDDERAAPRAAIVSVCPLRAGTLLWRPAPGSWALTVVCKATYRLAPEQMELTGRQEELNVHEAHWDDDPQRSAYAPSDLVPHKPRADVVLVGHAFAPQRTQVRSLVARMRVAGID